MNCETKDTTVFCRFCAQPKNDANEIVDLLQNLNVRNNCKNMLEFFNIDFINLSKNDYLRFIICEQCYRTMEKVYSFFVMVKQNRTNLACKSSEVVVKLEFPDEDIELPPMTTIVSELHFPDTTAYPIQSPKQKIKKTKRGIKPIVTSPLKTKVKRKIKMEKRQEILNDFEINCKQENPEPNLENTLNSSHFVEVKYAGHPITNEIGKGWIYYSWKCNQCPERCKTLSLLRTHATSVHHTCNSFECDNCSEKFLTFEQFVSHMRSYRENLCYFCKFCDHSSESIQECIAHEENHRKYLHICGMCGESFQGALSLSQHKKASSTYNNDSDDSISSVNFGDPSVSIGFKIPMLKSLITCWSEYPWICLLCKLAFVTMDQWRTHHKLEHNRCASYKCFDCDVYKPRKLQHLIAHIRAHRIELSLQCHICYEKKDSDDALKKHMEGHMVNHFWCDRCGEKFYDEHNLNTHLQKYNFKLIRKETYTTEDLTCKVCNKVYQRPKNLWHHEQTHKTQKIYSCDKCGKIFSLKSTFLKHMSKYDKKYECDTCGSRFSQRIHLINHINTHSDVKPFCCDECGYKCRNILRLRFHKARHMTHTPFICQICNKGFKTALYLKKHGLQHTGEKPYNCKFCNTSFANSSNCHKHMKRIHLALLMGNNS